MSHVHLLSNLIYDLYVLDPYIEIMCTGFKTDRTEVKSIKLKFESDDNERQTQSVLIFLLIKNKKNIAKG